MTEFSDLFLSVENPIFLLNAPKRCGKDTVARHMVNMCTIDHPVLNTVSFKDPIFKVFRATASQEVVDEMEKYYDAEGNWKDTPHPLLNGKSPRELLIHISENYIKPFFGDRYYGEELANSIDKGELGGKLKYTWVIPDCGFHSEVDAMYERFGERLIVVQFCRPGFESFVGDSRSFVTHDYATTVYESNEDGSEALAHRLMMMIKNGDH